MIEIVELPSEVHSRVPQYWIQTPPLVNGMTVSELTRGNMLKIDDGSEWAMNMRAHFQKYLPERKVVSFHELQFVKVCVGVVQ